MTIITLKCFCCQKKFNRKISEYNQSLKANQKRFFCSRSCSTTTRNQEKEPKYKCKICNAGVRWTRKYCKTCHDQKFNWLSRTLKDIKQATGSRNSYHTYLRQHARTIAKKHKLLEKCFFCSYSIYVHCHHKKPIAEFSEDTPVSVVNEISNLVGVCPNCHMEIKLGLKVF